MRGSLNRLISFELLFVLFLFSGVFKSHPFVQMFFPVNPTILLLILNVLSGIWLLYSRRVQIRPVAVVTLGVFGLFVLYAICSLFWATIDTYTIGKTIRLLSVTAWSIAGAALIISSSKSRVRVFSVILIVMGGVVLLEIAYISVTGNLWATPAFNSQSYLLPGTLLGAALVSTVALFSRNKTRGYIFFISILCISFLIGLLVNGARSPLLAGTGAIGIYCFLTLIATKDSMTIQIPSWFSYVGLSAVSGVGMVLILASRSSMRTIDRLQTLFSGGGNSANTRIELYNSAIEIISHRPVLGVGFGDFAREFERYSWPHNILLEVGAELGFIGLVLLLLLHALAVIYWKKRPISSTRIYVFALFCYFFALSLVTADINGNRFLFMSIGLLLIDSTDCID